MAAQQPYYGTNYQPSSRFQPTTQITPFARPQTVPPLNQRASWNTSPAKTVFNVGGVSMIGTGKTVSASMVMDRGITTYTCPANYMYVQIINHISVHSIINFFYQTTGKHVSSYRM